MESNGHDYPIVDVLSLFPDPDVQNAIVQQASSTDDWGVDSNDDEHLAWHVRGCLCGCCSDSRENVLLDTGEVVSYRIPGGFLTDPDGELSDDFGAALEQAVSRGVPVITVRQHSRCGAMGIIYAYHSHKDGENHVKEHYGDEFAAMAKQRANLYNEVEKNVIRKDKNGNDVFDFSHYEKNYGIALYGDEFVDYNDAARFQTCMAIQQGLWDAEQVAKECAELGGKTKTLTVFKHVAQNGTMYIQKLNEKGFIALPLPTAPDYEAKMNAILAQYPETMHHRIQAEALSRQEWIAQKEVNTLEKDKDMSVAQSPTEGVIRASGRKGDENYNFAKAPGQALFLRLFDNFMTHADGVMKFATSQFMELCRAYKVPVAQIEQVSTGEGLRAIYQYNKDEAGAEALRAAGRPRLVRLAKRRAHLYNEVRKKIERDGDMSHYEKRGIPLGESEAERFISCMALEQAEMNFNAAQKSYEKSVTRHKVALKTTAPEELQNIDKPLPTPVLFFKSLYGKKAVYAFYNNAKQYIKLPRLDDGGDIIKVPNYPSMKLGANALTKHL